MPRPRVTGAPPGHGQDVPGGGWEIQLNRGWGSEDKWVPWLTVRPCRTLQEAGWQGGNRGRWGLYAARKFCAGEAIGTTAEAEDMSDDIGKAGSDETKAALQAMYATGGGHHAT